MRSVAPSGCAWSIAAPETNADSLSPSISPDGRFIAYASFADNLVPGDTNFTSDVFLLDRSTARCSGSA